MPAIQFDVLVPDEHAEQLRVTFEEAAAKLVAAGKLSHARVEYLAQPPLYEGVELALRNSYREEHEDHDLENASVRRYLFHLDGAQGSLNQLAMVLSRFLTPQANLPADAVALENAAAHEVAATYPWSVEIFR